MIGPLRLTSFVALGDRLMKFDPSARLGFKTQNRKTQYTQKDPDEDEETPAGQLSLF